MLLPSSRECRVLGEFFRAEPIGAHVLYDMVPGFRGPGRILNSPPLRPCKKKQEKTKKKATTSSQSYSRKFKYSICIYIFRWDEKRRPDGCQAPGSNVNPATTNNPPQPPTKILRMASMTDAGELPFDRIYNFRDVGETINRHCSGR